MNTMLALSLFWTIYGIAGIFGFQKIHPKYKGYSWTKRYIRCQGISWIMLGVPCLIFERILAHLYPNIGISFGQAALIIVILAIPSVVFTYICEKKYAALLKKEQEE